MQITKDMIASISRLEIILQGDETFEIKSKDILDLWFDVEDCDRDECRLRDEYDEVDEFECENCCASYNHSNDGRLVISKNVLDSLSSFADGKSRDERAGYLFSNRVLQGESDNKELDVEQIKIYFHNNPHIEFFVTFYPLENDMFDYIEEYSNCSSAEIDEAGNVLMLFGDSSHSFQRVDNDYFTYIKGLNKFLKKPFKNMFLTLSVESIDNCECCSLDKNELFMETRIHNKGYYGRRLPLKFSGVQNFAFKFDFKYDAVGFFRISPTSNNKYFVQYNGDFCFYCKTIEVAQV